MKDVFSDCCTVLDAVASNKNPVEEFRRKVPQA